MRETRRTFATSKEIRAIASSRETSATPPPCAKRWTAASTRSSISRPKRTSIAPSPSPSHFLRTDALGSLVLLQALREHQITRFLQVSTDEVYGDVPNGESVESDPLRPRSPYAASKAAADLLVLAYHATYGSPVVVTRGSNTYGPNQYPEKIVPLFVTNLIDDRPVPLYGDGLQIRDWLYVDDHARAILHVLDSGEIGSVYNVFECDAANESRADARLCATLRTIDGEERRARHGSSRTRSAVRRELGEAARARMEPAHLLRRRHRPNDRLVSR